MKKKTILTLLAVTLISTTPSLVPPTTVYAQSDAWGTSAYDHVIANIYEHLSPAERQRIREAEIRNAKCLGKAAISASAAAIRGGWGGAAIAFMATLPTIYHQIQNTQVKTSTQL